MNRLQHETSPYLLQHKDNPVDWYAWKPEALERAKRENKPILVSIGYSTCHWCHVMEKESFEDESTAEIMNENFVCIKIDREERPDLDQIYMEACQIISGNGGWPLNCFLLPDGRPYFAGTYYPPAAAYNRPSWKQVLTRMADVFYTQPETVEDQAARLTDIIAGSGTALLKEPAVSLSREQIFSPVTLQQIFVQMHGRFDAENGGFGGAPKFPGAMSLRYLLQYAHFEKNPLALNHLLHSLEKMCRGGIYDLLGGGFARYTVDAAWLIPHFEKMLYDNALLVSLLSETVLKLRTLPGKEIQTKLFLDTIEETLTWVKREMTDSEGGFYSALDADSEGVEGKFYVWKKEEIEEILGEEAVLFCDYFDVSEEGNWEHNNILWRAKSLEEFAAEKGLSAEDLDRKFSAQKVKLFEAREKRIRPGLDDKILLDWNALMCSAYCKAFHATGNREYKDIAIKNVDFLLKTFEKEDKEGLYHSFKEGKRQYDAFLNDYAFLIEALLDVYEVSFNPRYLNEAKRLSDYLMEHFLDKADNLFYFTSEKQKDVVLRRKDLYDNAVPSGNSTMVRNLQKLGILFEIKEYKQLAAEMLVTIKETVERYPTSFARWANCLLNEVYSVLEVAVVGPEAEKTALEVQQHFIPNKVLMASKKSSEAYPLLAYKEDEETLIYVCRDYACSAPVQTVDDMMETLL